MPNKVYCAIVIGTGFAGAVTACRLVEAGFEICVLERGRRYEAADFPASLTADLFNPGTAPGTGANGDFSRWLWSSDHGLFDVRDLDGAVAVQSAGYGGGSLIYANVHLRPPKTVFDAWPAAYRDAEFDHYFDLAAFMLGATPIPARLAKTVQLQSAAETIKGDHHWFRAPLAITFQRPDGAATTPGNIDEPIVNAYGREQHVCDMRGRCFLGCDRQAKNTLDLNYLARAEDGVPAPDIRTLAEVTTIVRSDAGVFSVTYLDHLFHGAEKKVFARHVFLCAGSVGTTELLLNNPGLSKVPDAVGTHYFPNSDAFTAVFDCDKPQEADYGPTITAALVHNRPFDGGFKQSIDVYEGHLTNPRRILPAAGMTVRGVRSGATADLTFSPLLDSGGWEEGSAAGCLVVALLSESRFQEGEEVAIVTTADQPIASARARATLREHEHWFLVEDGGYPTDFAPLVGLFRSPLWLRRNRFLEVKAAPVVTARDGGRASAERAQVRAIAAALGNTTGRASSRDGYAGRSFSTGRTFGNTRAHLPDVLEQQVSTFFPDWFGNALKDARDDMFEQAANAALPMLGQILDRFSTSIVTQVDRGGFKFLPGDIEGNNQKKQVLVRGMLRQALQIVAGSEATVARLVTDLLLERFKGTPEGLLQMVSDALLWVLAYGSAEGNTALLLTMGRDPFRGRLLRDPDAPKDDPRIIARLPSARIDSSVVEQERLLREIARDAFRGELRTNPLWTPIETRVTVHSQGGCPMGEGDDGPMTPADTYAAQMARRFSVTDPLGRVRGCDGLYVMDAAAFPTSVGVNPSATIAAVAEFKVEQFIRRARPELPKWEARDKRHARLWCDARRADIDPLNAPRGTVAPALCDNPPPAVDVIGLTFSEQMQGFLERVHTGKRLAVDLAGFEKRKEAFVAAQDRGIGAGFGIETTLTITVRDLAELVSPELAEDPARAKVTGSITLTRPGQAPMKLGVRDDSVVQFFIRPPDTGGPPTRFFRYSLNVLGPISGHLDGVKMLFDDPGQDVWVDTSTLYFELTTVDGVYRGIMRLSLEEFLQTQLPSMRVTNVDDPSRQAWALTAFYAYFARNLTDVYMRRLHTLTTLAVNVLTGIHV